MHRIRDLVIAAIAAAVAAAAATPALAEGDVAAGATVFNKCKVCHVADAKTNKVGPNLNGIVGRPVASAEGYSYSTAMQGHAKTVPVWDEAALSAYLANPRGVVKGTKMAFAGLKKPEEIANVIAYLKSIPVVD